jgi:hypothetical protein
LIDWLIFYDGENIKLLTAHTYRCLLAAVTRDVINHGNSGIWKSIQIEMQVFGVIQTIISVVTDVYKCHYIRLNKPSRKPA